MGRETIERFIAWCKEKGVKPCYASSVLAYAEITKKQVVGGGI